MNYLLVKTEELDGQGYEYKYAERIPDGRVILPLSALKVLSNFSPDILSDEKLKALIKEQQESGLFNPPAAGGVTDETQSEEPGVDEGNGSELPADEPTIEVPVIEAPAIEEPTIEEGGNL